MDDGNYCWGFEKAFDNADHDILLKFWNIIALGESLINGLYLMVVIKINEWVKFGSICRVSKGSINDLYYAIEVGL